MAEQQSKNWATDPIAAAFTAQAKALVEQYDAHAAIASADESALIAEAVKQHADYAKVEKAREAYRAALMAVEAKVKDTISLPTDEQRKAAESAMATVKTSLNGVLIGISALPDYKDHVSEFLPPRVTDIVGTKRKASSSGSGTTKRPRIGFVKITDAENPDTVIYEAASKGDDHPTITKIAGILNGIDHADIMSAIPDSFSKDNPVAEFVMSPDKGYEFEDATIKHLNFELRWRQ